MSEQNPGHLAGKKKWLVARYPKPHGELIFLGSILTDPEEPESSLNRKTGAVKIPERDKYDESAAVRDKVHSDLSTNASGLLKVVPPNTPLFSAGLAAEGRSGDEVNTVVEAMNVSAEIFIPDRAYMDDSLEKPEITAYVMGWAWSKPLYMIVGVATAGTLAVTEEQSQERNVALSANASVAGTGTEVAVQVSRETMAKSGSSLKIENPTDFAYRVREFEYKKLLTKKFKDRGDRTEGAMFGMGEKDEWNPTNKDGVPAFDDWADDDWADEDTEVHGIFVLRI
ncbi:hypothetical protein MMC07_000019 [Pseudocyphellaria aurata]|nr:hypothetical protein [Pseudocyphellaria aurata]